MAKRKPQKRMTRIATFREAVSFLGGAVPVAEWLNTTPNNIANMMCRNYAARGYHLHLYLTLRRRGAEPAPQVFGLKSWDRIIMPRTQRRSRGARKTVNAHKHVNGG